MNDSVFKMNYVLLNNKVLKLKNENKEKDKKVLEFFDECKKNISENQKEYANKIKEMSDKINLLKSENERLTKENEFYKNSLNKIPFFILKIFGISKKVKIGRD